MEEQVLEMIALRLRALGDVSRLRIVETLRNGERSVGDLAQDLGLRHGSVSAHLRVLENAGLVGKRKQGTRVFYRLNSSLVENVCSVICSDLAIQLAGEVALLESLPEE